MTLPRSLEAMGDLWDNRTVMHRARRYRDLEEKRDLRRTSLKGVGLEVTPAQLAFA